MAELGPMDRAPDPHAPKAPHHFEYIVGDYVNLVVTIDHGMHLLEARVIFAHEDDESISIVFEGAPERIRGFSSSLMRSELHVSRMVEVDDVPGIYRLLRFEADTASMRTLQRSPASVRSNFEEFAIVPESNDLKAGVMIDSSTDPMFVTDQEEDL